MKSQHDLYYWTAENATAEIDFVVQHQNEIIPIEVKAEENLKSKSLKVYQDKFAPKQAFPSVLWCIQCDYFMKAIFGLAWAVDVVIRR